MYSILRTAKRQPRTPVAVLIKPTLEQVQTLLPLNSGLWAVDLETVGVDPSRFEDAAFGIGFANAEHCLYVDLRWAHPSVLEYLRAFLASVQLTSYNVKFDGGFLQKFTGRWLNWIGCSYGLFRYLATEGFNNQRWDLGTAQRDLLGWEVSNKTPIDSALAEQGLTKGDLYKLDPELVGVYCAGDADAHWQIWEELVKLCETNGFEHLLRFHQREFMTEVELLVEQQFLGMETDRAEMEAYHADLVSRRIPLTMDAFLNHPLIAHHIGSYNKAVYDAWKASEPPRLTKAGEEAARWVTWRDRKLPRFNPNSKQKLADLFYRKVFKIVRELGRVVVIEVAGKQYEVEKTDKGALSVKKQILPVFGEPGALLMAYNRLVKESGYVRAGLALLEERPTIHPEFNSAGTVTGRPAGGEADDD